MPSVLTLLTDPDEFFRERSADPSLKGPLAVVAVIAAIGALATLVQNQTIVQFIELAFRNASAQAGENQSAEEFTDLAIQFYLVFSYAIAIVGPFVFWLLYAAVFHAISALFDGEGGFSRTLAFVGWGRVPAAISALVTLAVNFYQFRVRDVTVPTDVSEESVQAFISELQVTELVVLNTALGIVFTLWAAYIWVYGLKHARNLSVREAALTVAVPVAVAVLFSVRSVLTVL